MPKHEVPPGHALIRLDDLAVLLNSRSRPQASYAATWDGLAAAVALLTAELGECKLSRAEIAGGTSSGTIAAALVIIAAAVLGNHEAETVQDILHDLGYLAASQGVGPGGEPL